MDDSFEVVRYRASDRDAIFTFLRTAYSDAACTRLARQWDWKYAHNPFNADADPYLLLVKHGAAVVAMMGSFPLRVCIGGTERRIVHVSDWVVHPEYRGRQLARRVVPRCRADLPIAFGWANTVSEHAGRVPSSRTAPLPRLVNPLDVAPLIYARTGSRLLSRFAGLLLRGARALGGSVRRCPIVPGITVSSVAAFDARSDALWQQTCADYPVMVVRDQRYLNWRFVDRPDAAYTILIATAGSELVGYVVLRVMDQPAGRFGYLVDFLVPRRSPALLTMLVGASLARFRQQGVVAVSCRAVGSAYRTIRSCGFYPLRWGSPTYLYTRLELSDPALAVFRDQSNWFLTMGDGDLDMSF